MTFDPKVIEGKFPKKEAEPLMTFSSSIVYADDLIVVLRNTYKIAGNTEITHQLIEIS